nr:expressed conserved protein [Hymenolepis microstoma]
MILNPRVSGALFSKLPLKCIERSAGDGRVPKVSTVGQRKRLIKQYEMTKQIVSLSSELNEANKRLVEKQNEETRRIKALSELPLKRKGSEQLV